MSVNNLYEFWFYNLSGINRSRKWELLKIHSEQELFSLKKEEWQLLLTKKEWNRFCKQSLPNNIEETEKEYEKLKEKQIRFLYWRQEDFPKKLIEIPDPPLGLYIKGSPPKEKKIIAIVGTRTPTAYGREMARVFARELSVAGITIVSGLAAGVDLAAHKGALEAGKKTYGVLGSGVDIVYPKENYMTYHQMLGQGGVLSEYKPNAAPMAYRFPERNRIISGLADGIFIVEAKGRSGSLITADCGLEQGKDIFVLPGRSIDPFSEGCNWLIRQGAKLVTKPSHILEDIYPECEKNLKNTNKKDKLLDNKEKIVYDCLGLEPKYVEDILRETNLTVSEGISILFRLELNGYIEQIVKDYYIIRL
ncbi:MAG: DNA-processing protein DprA [Lachnospiraceae bacterium]|nr:DNA-processing protein DprA [Lachnospiraceae bacterium]